MNLHEYQGKSIFTRAEEQKLVAHLQSMAEGGYGLTGFECRQRAAEYAVYIGRRQTDKVFSRGWLDKFMRRHPDLQV